MTNKQVLVLLWSIILLSSMSSQHMNLQLYLKTVENTFLINQNHDDHDDHDEHGEYDQL